MFYIYQLRHQSIKIVGLSLSMLKGKLQLAGLRIWVPRSNALSPKSTISSLNVSILIWNPKTDYQSLQNMCLCACKHTCMCWTRLEARVHV